VTPQLVLVELIVEVLRIEILPVNQRD
jgi:hypothetical protein